MGRIYFGRDNPDSLTAHEWETLEQGTWTVRCPVIALDNGHGRQYRGPGYIQEGQEGLQWHLFDNERATGLGDALAAFGAPGEWLSDELFFTLEALDLQGRIWRADNVRASYEGSEVPGTWVNGQTTDLRCSGEWTPQRSSARLLFRERLNLPPNTPVEVRTIVGEDESSQFSSERCRLEADGRRLEAVLGPSSTRITYWERPGEPLPPDLPYRIEEALWMTTGQAVRFAAAEESCVNSGARIRLHPVRRKARPSAWFRPPLNTKEPGAWAYFDQLFFSYLEHAVKTPAGRRHATSTGIWRIYRASTGSPQDLTLTLVVAIESLVKRYFRDSMVPSDEERTQLEEFMAFTCEAWQGPEAIRKRVLGAVGNWKGGSPAAALKRLAGEGLVSAEHVRAWKTTRDPHVHSTEGTGPTDKRTLENILVLQQLWTTLLLRAIGYDGPMTDWTAPGWPLRAPHEPGESPVE